MTTIFNDNYHIRISPDKYPGYLKGELLYKATFLKIPYLKNVCTLKNTSDYVLKVVNRWADEFKVPTENIIHLNK